MPKDEGVSVVVPTLDRGGFLENCLRDLLSQNYPQYEVIVVDQSLSPASGVARLLDTHADRLRHLRLDRRGLPHARNVGWQEARFSRVLYVDDDVRCPPSLVAEHVRALALDEVGVVGGGVDEPGRADDMCSRPGVLNRWTGMAARGFSAVGEGETDHAPGCNFSAWRHILAEVGGFDEQLTVGASLLEETELCLRVKAAGYRIYFNGSARLTHLVAPQGGCRVDNARSYVDAYAHNRGLLIGRHLTGVQRCAAHLRTLLLGLSFTKYHRDLALFRTCIAGYIRGQRKASRAPVCTTRATGAGVQ